MTQDIDHIETEYISVSELKKLHGFTDALIKKLLGECDTTKPNSKSKSAIPIKLYSVERVNKVLTDDAFIEWKNKKESASSKLNRTPVKIVEEVKATVQIKTIVVEEAKTVLAINAKAFDFVLGLSLLETAEWSDFNWEDFRIDDESKFSEEQKIHATATVKKMLSASYWFQPEVFFDAFVQYGADRDNRQVLASNYRESILTNGWRGIPLVTLMIRDRQDNTKVILDSGHHRWIALKELFEMGSLPNDFKIPVFDLKRLRSMVRSQYSSNLDFALSYAVTGGTLGHDFARRVISKGWFTRLCTGVDCSY